VIIWWAIKGVLGQKDELPKNYDGLKLIVSGQKPQDNNF
jgi:hypothetical protein